jgi:hypothetical protein
MHTYCACVCVDGFQPFKRRVYSVEAMYICILNLPRSERYKPENCILVGLAPPHCAGTGVLQKYLRTRAWNRLLTPLVEELNFLWTSGIQVSSLGLFRAALLNVACDLPAMRKLCGFMHHGARQGCSKCSTHFEVDPGDQKTRYSGNGFDTAAWPRRTNAGHRAAAQQERMQTNPSASERVAKDTGARWSMLLELPYLDPCRMAVPSCDVSGCMGRIRWI